jgi:hypothetical protein
MIISKKGVILRFYIIIINFFKDYSIGSRVFDTTRRGRMKIKIVKLS